MNFRGSLFCIHGFLGLPSDWDAILPAGIQSERLSLFSPRDEIPKMESLKELGKWINKRAQHLSEPRILVGYSLGGRIAQHALIDSPQLWAGAIIISAHPGLSDSYEKELRVNSDEKWAEKFETGSWSSVIAEWNSQQVFQGGKIELERSECQFSRKALGNALRSYSLGKQENLSESLKSIKIPILWLVGENDPKFKAIAEKLTSASSSLSVITVPHSGHRILIDNPVFLKNLFKNFLDKNYP